MVLDLFFPPLPLPFGPQFGPKTRGSPGPQGPSPGSATACSIQLFRERLSEKNVHATIPKGNMGYDQYTVPDDCSCRISYLWCFPLALANICPWPQVPFFQISLKKSELKTTHNTFWDCHVHFLRQPFSK